MGCKKSNRVLTLGVVDMSEKHTVNFCCFDIVVRKSLFSKIVGSYQANAPGAEMVTKSFEVSLSEGVVFTAGVCLAGDDQYAFVKAMELNEDMKEICSMSIREVTHREKKGLYRITRCEKDDILIAGGWVDVFVLRFINHKLTRLYSLMNLHAGNSSLC